MEGVEVQDYGETDCPVCFELMIDPIQTNCNHRFCKICLLKEFLGPRKICPMCRRRVTKVTELIESKSHIENQLVGQLEEEDKKGRLGIVAVRKKCNENILELGETEKLFRKLLAMDFEDITVMADGTVFHYIRNENGKLTGTIFTESEQVCFMPFGPMD